MKLKKWSLSACCFGLLLVLLTGCRGQGEALTDHTDKGSEAETAAMTESAAMTETAAMVETAAGKEVVFTDDLGREVCVENPQRVAALIGSFADMWYLAGGTVAAAADDSWKEFELPLGGEVVNTGSMLEPDVERLIAAEPDFVLASAALSGQTELEPVLANAGITVAYFDVCTFEDYLRMLEICTRITGRADLYEQNGLAVQSEVEQARQHADGSAPNVLLLRAGGRDVKAKGSEGTVCGEMLKDLGCVNIADSKAGLLEDLSMEAIIMEDPDFIFVVIQGDDSEAALKNVEEMLVSNPAWATLSAVKGGRYYVLEKELYHLKPNARWGEAYRKLAAILYP